jgi:hypothetical protein
MNEGISKEELVLAYVRPPHSDSFLVGRQDSLISESEDGSNKHGT